LKKPIYQGFHIEKDPLFDKFVRKAGHSHGRNAVTASKKGAPYKDTPTGLIGFFKNPVTMLVYR
jgi:hypothetical protein